MSVGNEVSDAEPLRLSPIAGYQHDLAANVIRVMRGRLDLGRRLQGPCFEKCSATVAARRGPVRQAF